tara:strand:+ start:4314 stop:6395 length:2082 start_codon:yes stop_codon:yes gene_type:complete
MVYLFYKKGFFMLKKLHSNMSYLLLCLCLMPLMAVTQENQDQELDEIYVTATRLSALLRDSARSVSIIDQEQIQNATQKLALDEVLAGVPGLYMQNRYNFAQDLRISLRGFGARSAFGIRGIKVIVDGIPETLPDGQAGVDSIDLGSAKRIEVIRGPASSHYGNAAGGVIAIESESGRNPAFIQTTFSGGDLGYKKYQIKTGGKNEKMDYLLNISSQDLTGFREHSKSEGTLFNGKFGFQINPSDRFNVAINHTDQPMAQDPGGINLAQVSANRASARDRNLSYDSGESLSQTRIGMVYEQNRDNGNLIIRNYYVTRDFSNKLPFKGGGSVNINRFFYGLGVQYDFNELLPENYNFTVGFDADRQDDDRKRYDNNSGIIGALTFDQQEKVSSNGLFAQGSYKNGNWSFSTGIRFDEVKFDIQDRFLSNGDDSGEVDFDAISPSLGLNYQLGNSIIYGNISSSFETPTTTELANPDSSGGFNSALKPQKANNIEIGFKSNYQNLLYEVAVFEIDLKDELTPYELESSPGRTFYSNVGKSSRSGIESALTWNIQSNFVIDLSYTWSDFTFDQFIDQNGKNFAGSKLPGLPESFAYFGIRYKSDDQLNVNFNVNYSGDLFANNANSVEVPSYVVSNFRLSYDFQQEDWMIMPYLGVNNLFDEEFNSNIRINAYGGRYYEPAPGRNSYLGVTLNYNF